jgi:hypothetical protein
MASAESRLVQENNKFYELFVVELSFEAFFASFHSTFSLETAE